MGLQSQSSLIFETFEKTVLQYPNKIALICNNKKLSYQQLYEKVNQLAECIQQQPNNHLIAILMDRSIEVLISMLAVLKIGKTYLNIDPHYPHDRIQYMLKNSKSSLILTNLNSLHPFDVIECCKVLDTITFYKPQETVEVKPWSDFDVASVIYTSGSTGAPKGVMVKYKGLENFYCFASRYFEFYRNPSQNVCLGVTSICFDVFLAESLCSLISGIPIVLATRSQLNNSQLLDELIKKYSVTMFFSPAHIMLYHMEHLPSDSAFSKLRYIVQAGEKFQKKHYQDLRAYCKDAIIYNAYGPTEATIYASVKQVDKVEDLNIGKPITNTQIYLYDHELNLVPDGKVGQLCIAGDGLARGYLYDKEKTDEKFIKDPQHGNEMIYLTGDLAYRLPNGDLQYVDRMDNQIKINGVRMELSEIEEQILKYTGIGECVVAYLQGNLVAFFTKQQVAQIEVDDLKRWLLSKLPLSMIPSYYIMLNKMPYLSSGKIDRNSDLLKQSLAEQKLQRQEKQPPRTEDEKKILEIICNKLKCDIGINQNIFHYGANSLLVFDIVYQLQSVGYDIKPIDIYKYNTVENLVEHRMKQHKPEQDLDTTQIQIKDILKLRKKISHGIQEKPTCYLVTGSTGFLGMHMINELLNNTQATIYCLVRKKGSASIQTRFFDVYQYYHGPIKECFKERLILLEGDLIKEKLGLHICDYKKIKSQISDVIHCAANVKYFNDEHVMEASNVTTVQNIIDFCLDSLARLHHMSTISVLEYMLIHTPDKKIDEYHFYNLEPCNTVMQNYFENHIYIYTKLKAERLIIQAQSKGLKCNIYRLGNLCARSCDNKFQINESDNAFFNFIQAVKVLKKLPQQAADLQVDITYIDYAAKAIFHLLQNPDPYQLNIYHILNPNFKSLKDLFADFDIEYIDDLESYKHYLAKQYSKNKISTQMLFAAEEYLNESYLNNPSFLKRLSLEKTGIKLAELGFEFYKEPKSDS